MFFNLCTPVTSRRLVRHLFLSFHNSHAHSFLYLYLRLSLSLFSMPQPRATPPARPSLARSLRASRFASGRTRPPPPRSLAPGHTTRLLAPSPSRRHRHLHALSCGESRVACVAVRVATAARGDNGRASTVDGDDGELSESVVRHDKKQQNYHPSLGVCV